MKAKNEKEVQEKQAVKSISEPSDWPVYPEGTKVRMVHCDRPGIISGPTMPNGADGGLRTPIRWGSGTITAWHPGFLRPFDTPESDDPDDVIVGNVVHCRGRSYMDGGIMVIIPAGLAFYNPPKAKKAKAKKKAKC